MTFPTMLLLPLLFNIKQPTGASHTQDKECIHPDFDAMNNNGHGSDGTTTIINKCTHLSCIHTTYNMCL